MFLAIIYIAGFLQVWIGLVMGVTIGLYLPITFLITEARGIIRKQMNDADNKKSFRSTDAFLNYETVKYFNNEDYEHKQYSDHVDIYQKAELKFQILNYLLNIIQATIISAGSF